MKLGLAELVRQVGQLPYQFLKDLPQATPGIKKCPIWWPWPHCLFQKIVIIRSHDQLCLEYFGKNIIEGAVDQIINLPRMTLKKSIYDIQFPKINIVPLVKSTIEMRSI